MLPSLLAPYPRRLSIPSRAPQLIPDQCLSFPLAASASISRRLVVITLFLVVQAPNEQASLASLIPHPVTRKQVDCRVMAHLSLSPCPGWAHVTTCLALLASTPKSSQHKGWHGPSPQATGPTTSTA